MWKFVRALRRSPELALAVAGMVCSTVAGVGSILGLVFGYLWWREWGHVLALAGTLCISASMWRTSVASRYRSRARAVRLALVGAAATAMGEREPAALSALSAVERDEVLAVFNADVEHVRHAFPEVNIVEEAAQARAAFAACLGRLAAEGA